VAACVKMKNTEQNVQNEVRVSLRRRGRDHLRGGARLDCGHAQFRVHHVQVVRQVVQHWHPGGEQSVQRCQSYSTLVWSTPKEASRAHTRYAQRTVVHTERAHKLLNHGLVAVSSRQELRTPVRVFQQAPTGGKNGE
jgi:hypothetical protein